MADDNNVNDAQADQQPPEPDPDLKGLDRLVGTWEVSGGAQGRVTYEWMEGGYFLIQHVDLDQHGQKIKVIGHERPFGACAWVLGLLMTPLKNPCIERYPS